MPQMEIRAGESMVLEIRPSWLNFIPHYVISIATVIFLGYAGQIAAGLSLAALILSVPLLMRYSRLYNLTNYRVVERKGLIARHTAEIDLDEIVLFNVHQSIWERLLCLGKIDMMSASDGGPDVVFWGINNPFRVKEIIWNLKAPRNRR